MGAFTEKVKDGFTKLPPALTLLKIVSLICGALLIIMGFWLFFASFITFSFSGVIVGFYLMLVLFNYLLKIITTILIFNQKIGRINGCTC